MSWLLASFVIVAGALSVGWIAYERARPSARMIALVATLAALAALGRDAFVALPDVKPITAITFVVGYALGPLAGFTVGAIGMLASNVLLGQGPYTPWQMVAWGLVGIFGALFGRLTGRRSSRIALALACALSALVAKEIMNVYTWTLSGTYTEPALLARVAEGLPFDITDTVASFLFGLAFAPELARLLARVRARMEVKWAPVGTLTPQAGTPTPRVPAAVRGAAPFAVALIAATIAIATHGGSALARTASSSTALAASSDYGRELSYLAGAQNANGGFGEARGRPSSELYSAWVAMGLAAAGRDPLSVTHGGHSVLDAIRSEVSTLEDVGDVERTILALHACGVSARSVGAANLEAKLLAAHRADGSFSGQVNLTAFAIFALRAEGRRPGASMLQQAGRWIERQQDSDGGFGFDTRGGSSEVDDTAAALQAILAAGLHPHAVIAHALGYITAAQNPDGGFPEGPGGESNAQSTAWAIQGLVAAGRNVSALRRDGSRSPLGYLETLVAPDGSIRYSRTSAQSPVWVTAEALIALAHKPFPVAPVTTQAPMRGASAVNAPASDAHAEEHRITGAAPAERHVGLRRVEAPAVQASALVSRSQAAALAAVLTSVDRSLANVAQRALLPIGVASGGGARAR